MSSRSYLSIGDVLTLLRQEFPDVTISKIRFLESQGLVNPERTPSGYRKFYEHDVERLRWVLRQQREHFLPLKVIKDRLDDEADSESSPTHPAPAEAPGVPASGEPVLVGRLATAESAEAASGEGRRTVAQGGGPTLPGIESGMSASNGGPANAPRPSTTHTVDPDATHRRTAVAPLAPVKEHPPTAAVGADEAQGGAPSVPTAGPAVRQRSRASGDSPPRPVARSPRSGPAPTPGGSPSVGAPAAGPIVPVVEDTAAAGPAAGGSGAHPGPTTPARDGGTSATPRAATGRGKGHRPTPSAAASASEGEVPAGASMSIQELSEASALDVGVLEQLCDFGLLAGTRVAGQLYFDDEALAVANLAAGFARFGVEPRHLRLYKNAADREAGFVEQIVIPLVRQRNPEARVRARETVDELATLGQQLRASLLRTALGNLLDP